METVYLVVNESRLVFASYDEDTAESKCQQLLDSAISDEIEESGRDEEDLTDDEYAEFAYSNAYNGGYYYCEGVSFDKKDEIVTTSKGDEFTCNDIMHMLEASQIDNDDILDDLDFDELDEYDFENEKYNFGDEE